MPSVTQDEIFQLYREKFVPVYADLVVLAQTKPTQILIEEVNVLSHIAQSQNQQIPETLREENLVKAKNHLIRATIDLHKLIFAELKGTLDKFALDSKDRLVFNKSDCDVLKGYTDFMKTGKEARRFEVLHIGHNPLDSIILYEKANEIGFELYESLDKVKLKKLKHSFTVLKIKEIALGIIIGITATVSTPYVVDTFKQFKKILLAYFSQSAP